MGASFSLADDPDFISVRQDLRTLKNTLSDYPSIKSQVADIGGAAARSLNYETLAGKITDVDAYNRKIADKISASPGQLGDSLNQKMADNAVFIAKIGKLLEDNTVFTNSLAATLTDTSKAFRTKITGPKGDSGEISSSAASVKDNLYNKKYTVWCADGDVCQLPLGSKGITSGEDIILTPKSNVKVVGTLNANGLNIIGTLNANGLNIKGGTSVHNPEKWETHFPFSGDGRNYIRGDTQISGNVDVKGNMKVGATTIDGATIKNSGRMHVSGEEELYLLNKKGVIIGKDWGGNGNLAVQGDIATNGTLKVGQWYLQEIGGDLRFHKGNPDDRWVTFGNDGQVYTRGRGGNALNY